MFDRIKNFKINIIMILALVTVFLFAGQPLAALKVPRFSRPSVQDSKPIDIKDYKGKVVLIVFWATWCGPCIEEIPSLNSLQKEYGPSGFSVIGISMDQGGPVLVEKMIKKIDIQYPVIMGNKEITTAFGGIFGLPTSYLVDRSGNVLKHYIGWTRHSVFEEDIKNIL